MNTSGEVADLMVKEGIQITESTAKLVGLGAKNLAAIVIALINDDTKLQGKTNLKQLLKSDKPLCILQIKENDISKFNAEAKKYGVLFTAVSDKTQKNGFCDIIAKQDDVTKLNYIMEKMGYTAPEIEPEPEKDTKEKPDGKEAPEQASEEQSKNHQPRAKNRENPHENKSSTYGDTEKEDRNIDRKPSVKKKVEEIKEQQAKDKAAKLPEKEKQQNFTQPNSKKKKKSKKKGKSR